VVDGISVVVLLLIVVRIMA